MAHCAISIVSANTFRKHVVDIPEKTLLVPFKNSFRHLGKTLLLGSSLQVLQKDIASTVREFVPGTLERRCEYCPETYCDYHTETHCECSGKKLRVPSGNPLQSIK